MAHALELLSPVTREWFTGAFAAPSEVQEGGWPRVAAGRHTLMCAPTGSGKTLAAFLWCIDRLSVEPAPAEADRCRVLYVSPLKALTVDVERNLRAPLRGIGLAGERMGVAVAPLRVAVRTGDTAAAERRDIERHPPDILITTPESLFLMLTSRARRVLGAVRWVIVDEIHSIADSKRGAHLALSLERLAELTDGDPQRIGLSATVRPLDEVARFLGGPRRDVDIVDTGPRASLDVCVEVPVEDMAELERGVDVPSGPAAAIGSGPPGPRNSIWPAIHPRLLELVRSHRSTIIFVNSRRLAERLAAQLNELAGEELVPAHHGSIARDQRMVIEDLLKQGRVPALVATSSLELGIDMGAVDLVIQVESPTSVARGLQRIGRAGHSLGQPSKGAIFPKYRGDLLECAAVVERMIDGDIESTRVPRNPIDVLAQQVVAMCAMDEWRVDELGALVRRAQPFAHLGDRALHSVLDMLSGRYPSDDFAELRPRIVWDRVEGVLRGRAGAQRLAVTSGGTIPDRGLYSVNLLDDGRRVGELDEEMVYETRPGETFVLGATTWRVAEITQSQVLVTPAPGEPGKIAFWHGDALGRPAEVGLSLGRLTRELGAVDREQALRRLRARALFDDRAATNLVAYLDEQVEATGAVPDDRTVVVERFRDQLGDWRVCVLSCWGARVHAPWALAVEARLRERFGAEVQAIHSDDGFAVRLPEADRAPDVDDLLIDPDELDDVVTTQLQGSALFAARFRENAARALLLPRRRPGSRTPLWLQRQRAHDLLQVAGRHADFPVLVETYRECLSDVFDMDALRSLMTAIRSRAVRVVAVDTEHPSPFASSLVFDYIARYMYEGDAPLAERRAQALTLDRDLLAELLGSDELRELLDPAVVDAMELELQGLDERRRPRDADEAADLLRRMGDLSPAEAAARGISRLWLEQLGRERRALEVRLGGDDRWVAAEDAARYRDAFGVALPRGLPDALLAPVAGALDSLLVRWARTHAPFTAAVPARRWSLPVVRVEERLRALASTGEVLAGAFRPGGSSREWCHAEVLRVLRRRSLAALRREVEPVAVDAHARFLLGWQGVGSSSRGADRLLEVVGQLQGCALPASVIERDVLPARVAAYTPQLLDNLLSLGEVAWVGRGALGSGDGRVALYLRGEASALIPVPEALPQSPVHLRLREHLAEHGASFFRELWDAAGGGDADDVLDALWDLVWAGEVTNDSYAPLRILGTRVRRAPHRPLLRLSPRAAGRWSLVAHLVRPPASPTERMEAAARMLLRRHGVVTREAVAAEGVPGGFSGLYPVLRAMEEAGRVRRGYFVDGLGGIQFALPGAVDRLRSARQPGGETVALAATDPANPYGVSQPWPAGEGRMARAAGAHVVLESGCLRVFQQRGGRSLVTAGEVGPAHLRALAAAAGPERLEVQSIDAQPVLASPLAPVLRQAGFESSPRGLVLFPERLPARV